MAQIPRFKAQDQWSPEEWLQYERRGVKPESQEYVEARYKALIDADLEPDRSTGESSDNELTAEEHFERMRQR